MSTLATSAERTASACVLAGPPGVGKTSVAPLAAARLGVPALDLDEVITVQEGRAPAQIIETNGEPRFRQAELHALQSLSKGSAVLALGGGTLTTAQARGAARRFGPVFGLQASQDTLQKRLQSGTGPRRPLLDQGLQALLQSREASSLSVDLRIDAEGSPEQVADVVALKAQQVTHIEAPVGPEHTRVLVGHGLDHAAVGALAHLEPQRPVLVLVDQGVPADAQARILDPVRAHFDTHVVPVPGGESVKQWAFAGQVLQDALAAGCGRQSVVLALGGGATCDLAGFVAHLLGRGAPLLLMPSTLLAQVDASVGGKCAVNMPAGRNLVGAFHPASDVLIDPSLLQSLDPAEYRSGLAELLKIGIIGDEQLFEALVHQRQATPELISRAVRLKAAIVARDPYDLGERRTLNLGHTLGHALETASAHQLRHGEAVAIGIAAMARYSAAAGWTSEAVAKRVIGGLQALGLPTSAEPNLLRQAAEHIGADKKGAAGNVALICIHGVAHVQVRTLPLNEARQCLVRHGEPR